MKTLEITRKKFLPYGKQSISESDIKAVIKVLQSDWLTQGPKIPEFERKLAETVNTSLAIACSNGTAALHLAMLALEVGPDDMVVTSANTFLASANCARFVGADVCFCDIDPETGLIDLNSLEKNIKADTKRKIKVIIPVHFAGQPTDVAAIYKLASKYNIRVVEDACHALGAYYSHKGQEYRIGECKHSDMTVFSFHPVKHVAMGEGGAVVTNNSRLAEKIRRFRNHGIQKADSKYDDYALSPDSDTNPWYYEMHELGFNYRLTDIQAALGITQLQKLSWSIKRRSEIAKYYYQLIKDYFPDRIIKPLQINPGSHHAYHLFVVLIDFEKAGVSRAKVMNKLRENGIGTQVHYIPVPLQPYYRALYGAKPGDFPNAEKYYLQALSLPMYPDLTQDDCERVINSLKTVMAAVL